jgi:hypothetical protein
LTSVENHQLFSPGGQLFDATQLVGTGDGEAAEGEGICWIATPADSGVPRFLLRTKFGLEAIATLEHLQLRLGLVAPGPPPENDAARRALLRIVRAIKRFAAAGQLRFNKVLRGLQVAKGRSLHKVFDSF